MGAQGAQEMISTTAMITEIPTTTMNSLTTDKLSIRDVDRIESNATDPFTSSTARATSTEHFVNVSQEATTASPTNGTVFHLTEETATTTTSPIPSTSTEPSSTTEITTTTFSPVEEHELLTASPTVTETNHTTIAADVSDQHSTKSGSPSTTVPSTSAETTETVTGNASSVNTPKSEIFTFLGMDTNESTTTEASSPATTISTTSQAPTTTTSTTISPTSIASTSPTTTTTLPTTSVSSTTHSAEGRLLPSRPISVANDSIPTTVNILPLENLSTNVSTSNGTTVTTTTQRPVTPTSFTEGTTKSSSSAPILPDSWFNSRPEWLKPTTKAPISANATTSMAPSIVSNKITTASPITGLTLPISTTLNVTLSASAAATFINISSTSATTDEPLKINISTERTAENAPSIQDYDTAGDVMDSDYVELILCPGSKTIEIEPGQLCNGKVDCPGATDEIDCSCRTRIDPARLCDNVFDCPSIEDELGCPGMSKLSHLNYFSHCLPYFNHIFCV